MSKADGRLGICHSGLVVWLNQEPKGAEVRELPAVCRPIAWDPTEQPCMFFRSIGFLLYSEVVLGLLWPVFSRFPCCSSQQGRGPWRDPTSFIDWGSQTDILMEEGGLLLLFLFVCWCFFVHLLMRETRGIKALFGSQPSSSPQEGWWFARWEISFLPPHAVTVWLH